MFEINAAIGAATTAIRILKTAVEARDDAKIKAAVTDISIQLLDVSTSSNRLAAENGALQVSLHTAQAEFRELREKWQSAKGRCLPNWVAWGSSMLTSLGLRVNSLTEQMKSRTMFANHASTAVRSVCLMLARQ